MESTLHDLNPPQDQVTGAFFPNAQNFVVTGGRFKSITNIHHAAPAEPPAFPTIPMGYLNLLRELRLNTDTREVDRHQIPVRRAHSARIHGSESTMTVAIYEGDKREENWQNAISQHSNLRHPNIIQLFGTSRTPKIHAAIFHDELIPAQQMAEKYDVSPIGTVYFRYFLVGAYQLHYFMIYDCFICRHPDLRLSDTMSAPYLETTRTGGCAQCGSAPQRVVSALI
ncbi:hypothetical protein B0H17DRAFT_699538 [Mycena rosella]|uniref:Protein kinase domain-containing protein n=1 Tax=Mycena rosella TaxID=1033263 RepID=A0AAD7GG01_MYCRO|nr:hypothetical protein B0H17DRAFT_699538 [Mycena rosella]